MNFDSPWVIAPLILIGISFLVWLWNTIDRHHMRSAVREANEIMRHQTRRPPHRPDLPRQLDPSTCPHERWSPRYDYKTHPGAVKVLESHCLDCGTPERGSGQ